MKVLIVGGVAGGAGAAARLRRNDENAEIIMFEKGEYISFANCGLPYYVGGVIEDKGALQLQTPASFHARFHVDVRTQHEVTAVDTAAKTVMVRNLAAGKEYSESYDKLILSPGASPVRPPVPGADLPHVFTLRNIPDTYSIHAYIEQYKPRTAVVVGGGYIGVEMAENLHSAGVSVSIVEAQDHVIAPLDADMAHAVHNHIRSKGVGLYLGRSVEKISSDAVTLSDGTQLEAGLVLLSVGVRPETGFLKGSGIPLGPRGEILVDDHQRTGVQDVFAVGDAVAVTNFVDGTQQIIPLASPANKQARIVADVVCGREASYHGTQGTAIAKVFDMTVAVTGDNEAALRRSGIEYYKCHTFTGSNAGYYPGSKMICLKLLFGHDGRILGAQATGMKGVDKRIDVLATAMRAGMTVYGLQELELAYAPPFSSAKDPVNVAGYVAGNILEGSMKPYYMEEVVPNGAVLLDVRTQGEYDAGHIDGARLLPVDAIRDNLDTLDKTKEHYIYCGVGLRGYVAQRILEQKGFHTRNLSGGYSLYKTMAQDARERGADIPDMTHCGMEKA